MPCDNTSRVADAPLHMAPSKHSPPRQRLGLARLAILLFFAVSGGAYGLEDVIGSSGPGMGLVLILLTPLIWSLPAALMVAELSAAIPEEGGYYVWVKRAMGPFWGFQEGWWSWLQSFVDMAIYPVLFAQYLSTLLSEHFGIAVLAQNEGAHWAVTLAVIWTFVWLNIRGVRSVGNAAVVFGIFILVPLAVMSAVGISHLILHPKAIWLPMTPPGTNLSSAFSVGLYVVMWNYLGWDAASTYAGEIENPQRNYPRALAVALPMVTLAYLLPVVAGLAVDGNWQEWVAGYFPKAASEVGGPWLGVWLAVGGMVFAGGMFNSLLMSYSRVPFAMAADGYFPAALTRLHPRHNTPYVAIVLCGVIYSVFTLSGFSELVVLSVLLYSFALILEFAALVVLRITAPAMPRPYRIPGGWPAIIIVSLLPVAVLGLALASTVAEHGWRSLALPMVTIATGPALYPVLRGRWPGATD